MQIIGLLALGFVIGWTAKSFVDWIAALSAPVQMRSTVQPTVPLAKPTVPLGEVAKLKPEVAKIKEELDAGKKFQLKEMPNIERPWTLHAPTGKHRAVNTEPHLELSRIQQEWQNGRRAS